jgi:hypothetical protein
LLTVIDCVVAPFDQRYDAEAGAVSVTEPPLQNVVGPLAVTTGVAGTGSTVTTTSSDVAQQPFADVMLTV